MIPVVRPKPLRTDAHNQVLGPQNIGKVNNINLFLRKNAMFHTLLEQYEGKVQDFSCSSVLVWVFVSEDWQLLGVENDSKLGHCKSN